MSEGRVIHIEEDDQLQKHIDQAGKKLVVVDFTATWCGPCRYIAPFFKDLSVKYADTDFLKVDVDQCQMAAAIHQISAMPTFLFFTDGKRVHEVRGADPNKLESEILQWREKLMKENSKRTAKDDRSAFIVDSQKVSAGKGLPCFNDLKTNEDAVFLDSSGILLRFAENVLRQPSNPKYRAVRLGNEIFQSRLLPVPGAVECLFQMGFQEMDDKLVLPQGSPLDMLDIMRHTIIDEQNRRKPLHQPNEKVQASGSASTASDSAGTMVCSALTDCCSEPVLKAGYRSFQWRPRCQTEQQTIFFERLKNSMQHVFLYENKRLQEMARQRMQFDNLKLKAKENSAKSRSSTDGSEDFVDERDCLLLLLLDWFKNNFFTWMNQPTCTNCNVNTQGTGSGLPSDDDIRWGAGVVELYRCPNCSRSYRFPRYNHPQKLLDTRTGRCGEWANCFTLCCIAAGFEARHVVDWTDHVWTEVYSEHQKRWLHCDPCENICDKPLLYEVGWGKKLSYLIAFSKEEVIDVSWRYSSKHKEMLSRRKEVPESWLNGVCFYMSRELQSQLPEGRKKLLSERSIAEHVQLLKEKNIISNDEKSGRISGSLAWRQIRGEVGPSKDDKVEGYVFVATDEELKTGRMRIRYCPAEDKYFRGHTDDFASCEEVMTSWEDGVHESVSMFRKVENDWKMVYLARQEEEVMGSITWAFKIDSPMYKVKSIDLIACAETFENGSVKWMLEGKNGKKYTIKPRDNHQYLSTPILRGLNEFKLSAQLSGGKGDVAWQHAQLFRQSIYDSHLFPLDIVIHFQKSS